MVGDQAGWSEESSSGVLANAVGSHSRERLGRQRACKSVLEAGQTNHIGSALYICTITILFISVSMHYSLCIDIVHEGSLQSRVGGFEPLRGEPLCFSG